MSNELWRGSIQPSPLNCYMRNKEFPFVVITKQMVHTLPNIKKIAIFSMYVREIVNVTVVTIARKYCILSNASIKNYSIHLCKTIKIYSNGMECFNPFPQLDALVRQCYGERETDSRESVKLNTPYIHHSIRSHRHQSIIPFIVCESRKIIQSFVT